MVHRKGIAHTPAEQVQHMTCNDVSMQELQSVSYKSPLNSKACYLTAQPKLAGCLPRHAAEPQSAQLP